jgi:hypothetical protein
LAACARTAGAGTIDATPAAARPAKKLRRDVPPRSQAGQLWNSMISLPVLF